MENSDSSVSLDDLKLAQLIGNRQKLKATATTTKFFSQIAQTFSTNVTIETSPCHQKVIGLFFRFAKYWMDFFNLNIPAILMTYHQMIVPLFLFSNCRHSRRCRQSLKRVWTGSSRMTRLFKQLFGQSLMRMVGQWLRAIRNHGLFPSILSAIPNE
ncbi:MAG: hypothetical protein BI182_11860 [Acetobacterium sp. MES1]|nr:MAG: hypothetical protein BI182_11860 [Acetobacterium sp. MES1]